MLIMAIFDLHCWQINGEINSSNKNDHLSVSVDGSEGNVDGKCVTKRISCFSLASAMGTPMARYVGTAVVATVEMGATHVGPLARKSPIPRPPRHVGGGGTRPPPSSSFGDSGP